MRLGLRMNKKTSSKSNPGSKRRIGKTKPKPFRFDLYWMFALMAAAAFSAFGLSFNIPVGYVATQSSLGFLVGVYCCYILGKDEDQCWFTMGWSSALIHIVFMLPFCVRSFLYGGQWGVYLFCSIFTTPFAAIFMPIPGLVLLTLVFNIVEHLKTGEN